MPGDSPLAADWSQVLARIQQTLDEAVAAVVLPPEPGPEPASWQALWQQASDRVGLRRQHLQARADALQQSAQQLETLLTFESEALAAWLAAAAEVRQKLAQGASRAIS